MENLDQVFSDFKDKAGDFLGDIVENATGRIKPINVKTDSKFELSPTTILVLCVVGFLLMRKM